MSTTRTHSRLQLLAAVVPAALYLALAARLHALVTADPDRWFHLGLARLGFVVGKLPQLPLLGWDKGFPDKEFLFHVLTRLAWLVGGDGAVAGVAPLLGVVAIGALVWASAQRVTAAGAAVAVVVLAPASLERLIFLRALVLGIACFLVVVGAVLRKNHWLALVGGALFALSYHAIYLPLAFLAIAAVVARLEGEPATRAILFAAIGLGVGTIVNPYFPGNVEVGVQALALAVNGSAALADMGMLETAPLAGDAVVLHWAPLWLTLVALVVMRVRAQPAPEVRTSVDVLLASAWAFAGLAVINPRAIEYAAPLAALAFSVGAPALAPRRVVGALLVVIGLASSLVLVKRVAEIDALARGSSSMGASDASVAAANALPADAAGTMVFTCEWDRSPFIFERRPDVMITDILYPGFLAAAAPALQEARQQLLKGTVIDVKGVLEAGFGARFALCRSDVVVAAMTADPRFVEIEPNAFAPQHLFRVIDDEDGAWVRALDVTGRATPDAVPPADARAQGTVQTPLGTAHRSAWIATGDGCVALRVPAADIDAHAGADLVGLAGSARVYRNGAPVVDALDGLPGRGVLELMAPLAPPLAAGDRLDVVSCARGARRGLSLSLWSRAHVDALCAARGRTAPATSSFPLAAVDSTCFAPLAVKR